MKIDVDPARLNLPTDATKEQVEAAFEARLGKPALIEAERDEWKKRAKEDQEELVKLRATVADASAKKKEIVIQAAIDAGKIAASQKELAGKIYDGKDGEALFNEWVKSQEESAYLMTRQSLKGPYQPVAIDADVELAQAVAEIQANNKNITEAAAVSLAYKRVPGLFDRVTEARRAKKAEKSGEGR